MSRVLVTGGAGFVGSHVLAQLLAAGHSARATLRDLAREPEVRAMMRVAGIDAGDRLSFVRADLQADAGWSEAAEGCACVMHVASPFPAARPANPDELIVPARDGALRVLRAARAAGVARVVMTSSFAAIGYGQAARGQPFDETSWTDPQAPGLSAYVQSKAVAERAAWDWIAREGGPLQLSVVNPVGIFGPVLGSDLSASTLIVRRMLEGGMPRCPRIYFGVVDVRDVADLHLRAMANPAAAGERFLAVAGECMSLFEVAQVLRRRLGAAASKAPRTQTPDWLLRVVALWNAQARGVLPDVGRVRTSTHEKATRVLGWQPLPNEEAIVATAESLLRLKLVDSKAPAPA